LNNPEKKQVENPHKFTEIGDEKYLLSINTVINKDFFLIYKPLKKRIIIFMARFFLLLFLLAALKVNSQNWYNKNIFENYTISIKFGPSIVVTEYKRDLSGIINEMNHQPGYSYTLGLSKFITPRWGFGYQYEYGYFHGFQDYPDFSAYRFGHVWISQMRIEPVIYRSNVYNHNFLITYKFIKSAEQKVVPFLTFNAGISKLTSKLLYAANSELIWAKTGRNEELKYGSVNFLRFNIGIGGGFEWVVDPKLTVNCSADITNVNDDNLDGVHNFKTPPPEGYKNFVSGVYGKVLIGLTYYINPNREKLQTKKPPKRNNNHRDFF